MYSTAIRNF
nr:unnamed protein product [Callosobruchus chinensis]